MPEDTMLTAEERFDAALTAMREPPPVDRQRIDRVAARAVLANAPASRATTWTLRAAAAIAIVVFGAAALTSARQAGTADRDLLTTSNASQSIDAPTMLTPVLATAARPIVFELDAPTARSVQVLGDFNRWSRDTNVMRRGNDGRWRITTMLPPGRYIYAFLVDGARFQRDPMRDAIEDRDFGVTGSELVVGEAP